MTYSIIGSGNVGTALARQFARSGIAVGIANTRGPDSIAPLAKELGDKVVPLTLEEALKADVVILAVPFRAHTNVARALSSWAGKVVVDAMNTYGVSPEELAGLPRPRNPAPVSGRTLFLIAALTLVFAEMAVSTFWKV